MAIINNDGNYLIGCCGPNQKSFTSRIDSVKMFSHRINSSFITCSISFLGRYQQDLCGVQGVKRRAIVDRLSIKAHCKSIKEVIKRLMSASQAIVVDKLNPIIVGWANNFSHVVSKKTFSTVDSQVWIKLWQWSKRRHPHKGLRWIKNKYFKRIGTRKWVFSAKVKDKAHTLKKHADTKIVRHIKVKGTKHVYDGDKVYWAKRGQKDPTVSTSVRTLLKKQDGKCTWCSHHFRFDDVMEVDHIKPKNEGGKDVYINLQLLHGHCHDTKTREDSKRYERELLTKSDWVKV